MEAMLHKLEGDPTFTFGLTVGAAELAGGKAATYEQVLAAEMSATRAAIMARDPVLARSAGTALGDPRALIYSPAQFEAFARETIALRDQLKTKTLPWHGERRVVVDAGGTLDRDLVWAARKDKFDPATLVKTEGADDVATLRELNTYMTRVNALDYVSHELGSDIVKTSKQVSDAVGLIKALESKQPLGKATYEQVAGVVRGSGPQAGTASESRFYDRAAGRKDRTVLNADIKDLGIDVIHGNARAMKKVAHGGDIDAVARGASDEIVEMKRKFVSNLEAYYRTELLPAVKQRAEARGRDVSRLLQVEAEPLLLLGGDEITISLPREFEELGVVPALVAHLQKHARSRVSVTRTGATLDGARGHEQAMKASEAGHDVLKKYEELAAHVRDVTKRRPGGQRDSDRAVIEYFEGHVDRRTRSHRRAAR